MLPTAWPRSGEVVEDELSLGYAESHERDHTQQLEGVVERASQDFEVTGRDYLDSIRI